MTETIIAATLERSSRTTPAHVMSIAITDRSKLVTVPFTISLNATTGEARLVTNTTLSSTADSGLAIDIRGDGESVSKGWTPALWIPHASIGLLLVVLAVASFVRFHCKNGHKYRKPVSTPKVWQELGMKDLMQQMNELSGISSGGTTSGVAGSMTIYTAGTAAGSTRIYTTEMTSEGMAALDSYQDITGRSPARREGDMSIYLHHSPGSGNSRQLSIRYVIPPPPQHPRQLQRDRFQQFMFGSPARPLTHRYRAVSLISGRDTVVPADGWAFNEGSAGGGPVLSEGWGSELGVMVPSHDCTSRWPSGDGSVLIPNVVGNLYGSASRNIATERASPPSPASTLCAVSKIENVPCDAASNARQEPISYNLTTTVLSSAISSICVLDVDKSPSSSATVSAVASDLAGPATKDAVL